MENERRSREDDLPTTKGTPQISEDDSDEGPLHAIIREETERHDDANGPRRIERGDQSEVQKGEDDGALGLTRTGQED